MSFIIDTDRLKKTHDFLTIIHDFDLNMTSLHKKSVFDDDDDDDDDDDG